ncbi:MAG: hypothetical protein LQ342_003210 [Letrouitia transgressa]|nr:MAG: hypothetical protein LQ342_003210 [Letrouitia transgressa]
MTSDAPVKVGILLLSPGVQLLDVAPIDILGMLEPQWLEAVHLPPHIIAQGAKLEYHFINENGKGPQQMTGGFRIEVTDSIDTCPPLDILLVGGPLPDYRPSPAVQKFLRTQYEHVDTFITICSGFIPALYSGILDGKVATAPRELLPDLKKEAPQVKWAEKRWTRDGKLWTSGSVANGQQLMVAYLREKYPKEIVDLTLGMSDIADRGQEFGEVLGH